jgi:hypothetical protein
MLVPAALPQQARRCPHPGPNGRSLPSIAADGTPDGADELILLKLLLALPLLRVGKDLRRHLTGDQAESQSHIDRDTPSM